VYDTVYLASKPDTVFVIMLCTESDRYLLKLINRTYNVEVPAKGINMKEKEELENFGFGIEDFLFALDRFIGN
jgi:hypothetical protein